MLNSDYVAMGISRVFVAGNPFGWYWTNDFSGAQSNASAPSGGSPTGTPIAMTKRHDATCPECEPNRG
jgi:hypothetical protein